MAPEFMRESTQVIVRTKLEDRFVMAPVQVIYRTYSLPEILVIDAGAILKIAGFAAIVHTEFHAIFEVVNDDILLPRKPHDPKIVFFS